MKRLRYKDAESPRAYLENVLNRWTVFCEINGGLAQAISDMLVEVDDLHRENRRLRLALQGKRKSSFPKE